MIKFKALLNRWFYQPEISETDIGWKQYLVYALIAILVLIFTFPNFSPEIKPGLDGSEVFAFNYLFYHHVQFGTHVIFTYGPLGFLWTPLCIGNNLLTAIIFSNILRFIFIYTFLILGYWVNKSYRVLHIILVIGFCNVIYIDMAFIGATILTVLLFHLRKEIGWLIIGCAIASVALLVKSSYGLISISILLSYSIYALFSTKRPYVILYVSAFTSFFFLFTWFLLYHNISGILTYFQAMYEFSRDNANAYQLEVVNHWAILCVALISFYLPLFFTKSKLTRVLYLISIAALFAAFKYSFAREENWHQVFLFNFCIMICVMFLLLNSNIKPIVMMLPLAVISLLYVNMIRTKTYSIDYRIRVTGIDNFITFVLDYNNTVKKARIADSLTLQTKILDEEQRALIENNTVDCYPMELTYVGANTLNWDPRPSMQILAYTPWLDNHDASFLSSKDAPQFYIWQLEQPPLNNYSLDNHYLLNEEPKFIFSFLNHYQLIDSDSITALFKHANKNLLSEEHVTRSTIGYLDKWLNIVPSDSNSVVRARLSFQSAFKGILRRIFYRDQLYFIDYMLQDGTVKSYRFVPGNAVSGLWINPLVIDITKGLKGAEKVKAIRIHTSESGCIANSFLIDWTIFHIM